jgi:hypothetical protein
MTPLKNLREALRHVKKPDPTVLWTRILAVAVTENPYTIETRIRILLDLKLRDFPSLFEYADAMSQTVYETPDEHFRMHQLAALIRKYPLEPSLSGMNPEEKARGTFASAEHRCKRVNQRILAVRRVNRDRHWKLIFQMRGFIAFVLGDIPPLQSIYRAADFTGGAAIGVHGNATNFARKATSDVWTTTSRALSHSFGAVMKNFHLCELLLAREGQSVVCLDPVLLGQALREKVQCVHYNKLAFVPKTAKTHRSIAVEPLLNSYVQNGIDKVLRGKLLKIGIDLRRQSPNQEMARKGSIEAENPYCTIDLSSASDTIATELVAELLPPLWFDLLDQTRSHYYKDGLKVRKYEKFVSMGNGFCFPLQTLIFAAVCHACSRERDVPVDFRVYGDDIIVRQEVAEDVVARLRVLGFLPNPRKTFLKGSFRESCGTDWHTGVNVRPIFVDKPLDSWGRIYGLHNQSLRREAHVHQYWAPIRDLLFKLVPKIVRLVSYHDPRQEEDKRNDDYSPNPWDTKDVIDGAFWVPLDVFMCGKYVAWNTHIQNWSYTILRSSPAVDTAFVPSKTEGNPLIYLIGALRGGDSARPFTLRYSAQTKIAVINSQR